MKLYREAAGQKIQAGKRGIRQLSVFQTNISSAKLGSKLQQPNSTEFG